MKDWESYWQTINENSAGFKIFWDSMPENASMEDLARFQSYMEPDLPLLDMGCGNGRQTRFLARFFDRVIGVDISQAAVELARKETGEVENIEYRVLNAVNIEEAEALHAEFGDFNIYMRGVLHLIKMRDRKNFISSLEVLLGEKGVLYQIELPTKAFYHLRKVPEEVSVMIPRLVRRIGFNLEEKEFYFPQTCWEVIAEGEDVTINTMAFSDDSDGALPANYLILKRKLLNKQSISRR